MKKAESKLEKQLPAIKSSNHVFLLGNGISKYLHNVPNWYDLVRMLDTKSCLSKYNIQGCDDSLNCPELFSLLSVELQRKQQNHTNAACQLKKDVAELLQQKKRSSKLLEYASRKRRPILTTNFDFAIEKYYQWKISYNSPCRYDWPGIFSSQRRQYRFSECFRSPTDCSTEKEKCCAVWHIHGSCLHPRSILLGQNDYVAALTYIRNNIFIEKFGGKHHNPCDSGNWMGENTWLDLFFNHPLVIAGLSLISEELFLRNLLLFRQKALLARNKKTEDCYLSVEGHTLPAFLQALNVQNISFRSYRELYDSELWK